MTESNPVAVRMCFDIDFPTYKRIHHLIPRGSKSHIMRAAMRRLLSDIETQGHGAVTELMESFGEPEPDDAS